MCVLMAFNDRSSFTYDELMESTKVPDRDLKRALMSMAMGKAAQRVLKREGTSREIGNYFVLLLWLFLRPF